MTATAERPDPFRLFDEELLRKVVFEMNYASVARLGGYAKCREALVMGLDCSGRLLFLINTQFDSHVARLGREDAERFEAQTRDLFQTTADAVTWLDENKENLPP